MYRWKKIHDDFGKLDFEELFIPAINIARDGFKVTKVVANAWNKSLKKLSEDKNSKKIVLNNGRIYKIGDLRKSEPLARTLELISKRGISEFYSGPIAESGSKGGDDAEE